jgi:putative glycosyltransferase (TIGR04372 family)
MTQPPASLDAPLVLDDAMTERVFSTETMATFLRLVLPFLQDQRRVLSYVLPASGRFAHMALEPWALINLFGESFTSIVVVIHDRRRLPFSHGMHQVSSEVVNFVETDEELIPMMGHYDGKSHEVGPLRVHIQSAPRLLRDLWRHVRAGNALRYLALPEALERRGADFLSRIGLAPRDRFVTLHMREASYLSAHRYHGFRNMTPANYQRCALHLLDQGLWVFRLGDKDSKPLDIDHPRFVNLPGLEDYEDFMDVVLLAKAWFAICCSSGPLGPAIAFGTPVLMVNGILEHQTFFNSRDLVQFKRYVDETTDQAIPYAELLRRGIGELTLANEFETNQIRLEENTPDEILAAVREMSARLEGVFEPDPKLDQEFRSANEALLARLQAGDDGPDQVEPQDRAFGLALPWTNICHAYCRTNPWFLGTEC